MDAGMIASELPFVFFPQAAGRFSRQIYTLSLMPTKFSGARRRASSRAARIFALPWTVLIG